ncbi:MAG: carbohydrate ABC transporter permease [Oscillospiraceae bacterium]|nr:carbohydrate ABC transporter permease [Oscillospiraceae bacterium]
MNNDRTAALTKKNYKPKRSSFKELLQRNRDSGGYLFRKNVGHWFFVFVRGVLLFGLCFLILQPLLNKIALSFMSEADIFDPTVHNIPREFTTDNYTMTALLMTYWMSLRNTFFLTLVIAFLQVAACTFVGYGFARFKFPLKNFWFGCVMVLILVPPQTILSTLYLHFYNFDVFGIITFFRGLFFTPAQEGDVLGPLNLLGSPLPYLMMSATCMGLKNGLYIYMIRQYFRNVPKDIEEAAYVDGCGKFKTFYAIMLPDAKAIIVSCFLFSFVWQWTDSLFSNLFLRSMNVLSSTVGTLDESLTDYFISNYGRNAFPSLGYQQQIVATGMLMFIAPLILLYLVAQKGFVESISQSGIKM